MTYFLQAPLNISVAHEVTDKHDAQTPRLSQTISFLRKYLYRNFRYIPQKQTHCSSNNNRRSVRKNAITSKTKELRFLVKLLRNISNTTTFY